MHSRRFHRLLFLLIFGVLCFGLGYLSRHGIKASLVQIYLRIAPVTWTAGVPKPGRFLNGADAASAPIARFEPGVAAAYGRIFILGGFFNKLLWATSRCDAFDGAANSWTRLADMPVPVTHAGVAVVGEELWVAGGFVGAHPGNVTPAVWRYHIPTNRWFSGPMLPEARGAGGLAFVAGEVHFVGGLKSDRQTDAADHWSISPEPGAEWRARTPLPNARNHFSTVVVGGDIHVLGGQHGHDLSFTDLSDHHVYDASADSWRVAASLPIPRSHTEPGSFFEGGMIFLAGGRSNSIPVLFDVDAYDVATGTWRAVGGLPQGERAPVARVIGANFYAGLGGINVYGIDPSTEWRRYPASELGLAQPLPGTRP